MSDELDAWRAGRKPDPKPRRRQITHGVGARVVRELKRCQLCGARTLALDAHHLVPRSQGGDDVVANYAPLCTFPAFKEDRAGCHQRVTENDPATLTELRTSLDLLQIAYIVERKGQAWLDDRYPPRNDRK